MADLSKTGIESWLDRLPADVRSVMEGDIDAAPDPAAINFAAKMDEAANTPEVVEAQEKMLELIEANGDLFEKLGRARRLRFLAWFVAKTYPDSSQPVRILIDGYDDEESQGGRGTIGKVSMILAEDLRALVAALGPRAAKLIVTEGTLEAVTGAGYEVTTEMEMRQGGSV